MAGTGGIAVRPPAVTVPAPPAGGQAYRPPAPGRPRDAWPHTSRWLPWLLAAFLVLVWLVPMDSTQLRVHLPFDLTLDRLAMAGIGLLWLGTVLTGGREAPRWRPSSIDAWVLVVVGLAVASILVNVGALVVQDEITLALKKLTLLLSYVTFFFVAATTIRRTELRAFLRLVVVLAAVTAGGAVYQRYTGHNLFFQWWRDIAPNGLVKIDPKYGFVSNYVVNGPTRHPLALVLMLSMVMPGLFVVAASRDRSRLARLVGVALVVLFAVAIFGTHRKTGNLAAVAGILTIVALRPQQLIRLVPAVIVAFLVLSLVKPHAVTYQLEQINPSRVAVDASGENRKTDYAATVPDVRTHPMIGRGFGSYDANKYRILDNNYLMLLIECGPLGLAGMCALEVAVLLRARLGARSSDPRRAGPALAAAGAGAAFAVGMALFDAMSFAQVPYVFFFFAAVVSISAAPDPWGEVGGVVRRSRPAAPAAPKPPAGPPHRPPVRSPHEGRRRRPLASPSRRRRPMPPPPPIPPREPDARAAVAAPVTPVAQAKPAATPRSGRRRGRVLGTLLFLSGLAGIGVLVARASDPPTIASGQPAPLPHDRAVAVAVAPAPAERRAPRSVPAPAHRLHHAVPGAAPHHAHGSAGRKAAPPPSTGHERTAVHEHAAQRPAAPSPRHATPARPHPDASRPHVPAHRSPAPTHPASAAGAGAQPAAPAQSPAPSTAKQECVVPSQVAAATGVDVCKVTPAANALG
jgi:O-antigen ligase